MGGARTLISEHPDHLLRTERGYGTATKPDDYLDGFGKWLRENMNKIPALNCDRLGDLPVGIREAAKDLFEFAFSLLTDLGVRDRHYLAIYEAISYHVCPFCGLEYFDAPGAPREDLDHYLASSHYPFAASNLRNLSPMGMKCNERYKLAVDILRDEHGNRRRSFDPYTIRNLRISLLNSVPFGGGDGQNPAWQIDFVRDSAECGTWDQVFRLRERMQRDVLDRSFGGWLNEFAIWFVTRKGIADVGDSRLIDGVREYAEDMLMQGFKAREFLRAHVFEMLHQYCVRGDRRLLDFIRDLVTQAVPQPAIAA